jgi:G:T/U-mismatch repair DNA glycosylase
MTLDEHLLSGVEHHPLEPFLPENAVLLMLGSFPPQKKRWSMDFFYPNLQNDMWRIFGFIFFDDKDYFLSPEKIFDKERIIAFLREKGIALYDTASCVRRLQDNASDKFLEVVSPTDIGLLLQQLPSCRAVVTTGQKATDVFCEQMEAKEPPVGGGSAFHFRDRELTLYRMPSSSHNETQGGKKWLSKRVRCSRLACSAHSSALACIPSRCDSGFEQSRLPSIPRPFSTLPLSPALLMTGISYPAI